MRAGDHKQTSAQRNAAAARHVEEQRHKEKPLAPAYLTPGASVVWYEIMEAVSSDHFQPEDYRALAAFCEQCSLYERMSSDADVEPYTVASGDEGVKVNPFHTLYRNTANTINQLALRLKLAPSARTRDSAGAKAARGMEAAARGSPRSGLMFTGGKRGNDSGQ